MPSRTADGIGCSVGAATLSAPASREDHKAVQRTGSIRRQGETRDWSMNSDITKRILDAVDAGFDAQLATTRDLVAIPSTRGAEGPCQDVNYPALKGGACKSNQTGSG